MEARSRAKQEHKWEEADRLNKQFRSSLKADKTKMILNKFRDELDMRTNGWD